MRLIRCPNGHFYQSEQYASCPYCTAYEQPKPSVQLPQRLAHLGEPTQIGRGATSTVWRICGKTDLALKKVHCEHNVQNHERAMHEIRIMEHLKGVPGVMPLLEYETAEDSSIWLVMPYVRTFSEYIKSENVMTTDVIRMMMDVCDALEACRLHGVLHLDVQPKNLFVNDQGQMILGDFGTALFVEEAAQLHTPRGTLAYMAPEVYREGRVSPQSDLYSLGLVLYGLFNGRKLPFMSYAGDEDTAIFKRLAGTELPDCEELKGVKNAQEPAAITMAIIRKMCAFYPEDRYADPAECKEALKDLLRRIEDFLEENCEPSDDDASWYMLGSSFVEDSLEDDRNTCTDFDTDSDPEWEPAFFDADQLATSMIESGNDACFGESAASEATWFDADKLATTAASFDDIKVDRPVSETPPDVLPVRAQAAPQTGECRVCGRGLQLGATFCPFCGSRQIPLQPSVPISSVQFSAIAPKMLVKGEYSLINIVMYEPAFRHAVEEIIRDADGPVSETKSGAAHVRSGAQVMIRLTSPDLSIEDNEEVCVWVGEWLQFSFAVLLPEDFRKKQVLFTAQVYVDGMIATRLKFIARCFSLREQKMEVFRSDVLSAFVSYASKDRARVAAIVQGMQKARPDMDIFFDVESLRSGSDWEKVLYNEIERRDVLYLCWSHNASDSPWVRREWEYAYETKGADGIEPIPIDPPDVCPPPSKLAGKHFSDRCLYLIKSLEKNNTENY